MKTWLDDPSLTAEVASDLEGERRAANGYNEAYLRLYHNVPLTGIDGERDVGIIRTKIFESLRKRGYNLMREMLDGSASQICRKVAAKLTPVGGDYEIYRNCRTMNRLLDGVTEHLNAYAYMRRAFRDAQKCDIGVVAAGMDRKGEFWLQRWNPLWTLWPDEGVDGTGGAEDGPWTVMYVDSVPKDNLKALYPDKAEAIEKLPEWQRPKVSGVHKGSERSKHAYCVKVIWAYARKIGDREGKYVVACENGLVLEDKPWPYKRLPVVIFRWDWNHEGFGGTSLAEILEPYHQRVKANIKVIDQCLKGARPVVHVPEDRWQDAKFSDLPFTKIPFDPAQGPPPQVVPLQTVPGDLLKSVESDYLRAAAESGHSQALTAGQAPNSITSGKGLREYVAIANQRLSDKQAIWEQGWCDLAHVIVMLGNSNYQNRTVRVSAPQSDWLEEIKWLGPEKLRENQYKVQYKPTTGVSNTIAGMYEDIEYLKGSGVPVTPAEITRLVASNVPDVASLADRLNAPADLAEKMIDQALHGEMGSVVPMPTAMQGPNLHTMLEMAKQRYQQTLTRLNVPRWRKQRLRRLIAMIEARLAPPPTAPANPAPVPEPQPPVVDPNAPPPAEMLPPAEPIPAVM